MNPNQTILWLQAIYKASLQLGNTKRIISSSEKKSLNDLSRGVYAKKDIQIGSKLTKLNTYFAFPKKPDQLSSGQFKNNMLSTRKYKKDEEIVEVNRSRDLEIIRKYLKHA